MYERSAGSPARGWVRQEKLIPVTVMTPQGPMHQFREHYLNRQIQEKRLYYCSKLSAVNTGCRNKRKLLPQTGIFNSKPKTN